MKHEKLKVTINYYQPYLPPKCRKYRYEEKTEEIKLDIRMTTTDDAPIAFLLSDYHHTSSCQTEIRSFKGKLYKQMRCFGQGDQRYAPVKTTMLKDKLGNDVCYTWDAEERSRDYCVAQCKEYAKKYLIIDGYVWEQCGEPRYVVNTFGLGHNHGGTGLFVEEYYNPNIANTNYFSALDGKKAVEHANQVASRRGDTKDVGRFVEMIEVLIPKCVKIKPQKEHGSGCEVINALNSITENSSSALEAGLLTILYCKP